MKVQSNFVRFALLVVLGSSLVVARPDKNPDTEDYDYETENEPGKVESKGGDVKVDIPEFISKNESYEAVIGSDLTLACQVNKLEVNQLIWKVKYHNDTSKNEPQILIVGEHWFGDRSKYELKTLMSEGDAEGNTLTVKNVTPGDAGKYICSIALPVPKDVHFDVTVVAESKETHHHTDAATSGGARRSSDNCATIVMFLLLVWAFFVRD